MKRILTCFIIVIILGPVNLFAQDWVRMMDDPNANVHDVQAAFSKWYENHKGDNAGKNTEKNNKEAEEEGRELFKRWEYYMVPRSSPNGTRPNMSAIRSQYNNYLNTQKNNSAQRTLSNPNWTYAGNDSIPESGSAESGDGRVNRLFFYPGNTNTIYACAPTGGLWKTTNGGKTWSTNTDNLKELGSGTLAINPLKPSIMYLGTGDNDGLNHYSIATIGVLRSADGGNTWDTTAFSYQLGTSGAQRIAINQLIFNPQDTGTLFAATSRGLFYTKNDGASWTKVINDTIKDIEFEPLHSATVYTGSYRGEFYRSVNSGLTFTRVTVGLPSSGIGRVAIGTTAADTNRVYLLAVDSATYAFYGLYYSTDHGQTFTTKSLLSSGAPNLLGWSTTGSDASGQAWYNLVIAVSPTYADSVFVAGSYLWQSTDGGSTWAFNNNFNNEVHVDVHSIVFYPGSSSSFLLSSDGGVFKTTDAGNTWTNLSSNLQISEQYSIGPSADTTWWLTGWQDNGTNLESAKDAAQVFGGDGMTCFIDYTNDDNLFVSSEDGNFYEYYSGSWFPANSGITEPGNWNTLWLQDPQQPNNLLAGFQNVWESNDQGFSWSPISSFGTSYPVTALAIAPSNDNYMYAANTYSIYSTSNGGGTWNDISIPFPTDTVYVSGIAIDPTNPLRIWVSCSGWNSVNKVFSSTNGGSTWTNISSGLPNLPVNCILYQPGSLDGIYIGTDIGVYYRDATLSGWITYDNGLPNVEVFDLKYYQPGNLIVAATFGRGTWQVAAKPRAKTSTAINQITNTNSFRVYPNPTNGNVQMVFNGLAGDYDLNVTDVIGQTILENKITSDGNYTGEINLSGCSKGVYIISLNGQNVKVEKKVVVY